MKQKKWSVTILDKPNIATILENNDFYTTDTEAFLVFELKDSSFYPTSATITLHNRTDGSVVNEDVEVVDGTIAYEMRQEVIEHAGGWQAQLVYGQDKDGVPEKYTSQVVSFNVAGHLLDAKKPALVVIENWDNFVLSAESLIEDWEQNEALRVAAEHDRESAEDKRASTFAYNENSRKDEFEANEADRQQEFEANELVRQSQEESREIAETARQESYDDLIDTGVMQENINQKLAESEAEYAPRLTQLEQNDADLTAHLAQKANDEEVRKKAVKLDLEDLSPTVLSAIEGGEGTSFDLLSIPQDNSITDNKIAFGGLDPAVALKGVNKGLRRTINLFDKDNIILDGYYSPSTGEWIDSVHYVSSGFIPIDSGIYKRTGMDSIIRWDKDKNFISGAGQSATQYFTIGPDVHFVTLAVFKSSLDSTMFTLESEFPDTYVPYTVDEYRFDDSWNMTHGKTFEQTLLKGVYEETGVRTVNLFDKDNIILDGYYSPNTGEWRDNVGYFSSDFIPIDSGIYKGSGTASIVKWDKDKNFISGEQSAAQTYTAGPDVHFVTLAVPKGSIDSAMLTLESEFPDTYVPYTIDEYRFDDSWGVVNRDNLSVAVKKAGDTLNQKIEDIDKKVDEMSNLYSKDFVEPIQLDLDDFSGYKQPYHPSVLYFEGGFNGFKYWLVQTPFPTGGSPYRDRWECPVVYKSNDGVDWTAVADPLDDLTQAEIESTDYMSDPHLVYREDTQTLEVWYRYTRRGEDGRLPTKVIRKTTTDGVNWTEREEMIPEELHTTSTFVRSPSILWDNENKKYRIWYSNNAGDHYNTLEDNGVWDTSKQQTLSIDTRNRYWHIDVNYFNGKYHFLGYSRTNQQTIVHHTSDNGIDFGKGTTILDSSDGNPIYSRSLYRACSLLDEFGNVMVYFSGNNYENQARIGLVVAESFEKMNVIKRVSGNKVILDSGITVEELAKEFFELKKSL